MNKWVTLKANFNLQTLPFSRLADRIVGAYRGSKGETRRGGSLSRTLGDLISGD